MATVDERLQLPLAELDSINGMAQEAFDNAEAHGFHEDGNPPTPEMLIVEKVGPATLL